MSGKNYDIGYKRPPKATQWQKGRSGNPRGRATGQCNLKTELLEELGEVISIREGGTPKRVSKLRALIKAQTAKAVQGDTKATGLLLSTIIRVLDRQAPEEEPTDVAAEDRAIIESFLNRQSTIQGDAK